MESLISEFDQEMATTRRLLERVPTEKGDWKPHPKSFSLGHLTQLLARMPRWLVEMLGTTGLDLSESAPYSLETTETLLAEFDENVRVAREALSKDVDMSEPWSLTMRGHVLFTAPRGTVVRQHINHMVHHRGQLSVYLRLIDVPVPSIYGPTADEPWGAVQT